MDVELTQQKLLIFVEDRAKREYLQIIGISLSLANVLQTTLNSSLQAASKDGHFDVVERLLQAKTGVNAAAAARAGSKTTLQAAARGRYFNIVKRLL